MNRLNYQDGSIEQLKEERKKLYAEMNPLKHKKEDFDRRYIFEKLFKRNECEFDLW